MRMYDIILKKRDGMELTTAEIQYFINSYMSGSIQDYQVSALLMAIYFRGLNERETTDLTMAICDSGERADLSAIPGVKVDKHSTGGVGDKTTLVLVPLAAAAGVPVAKMSGRGLGHTGGTVDKLESIPGFKVDLGTAQFIDQVRRIGAAVAAQTGRLAPADKKLYALRDVTATVDSIPLIASSVMSKKIASGADAIVLDVKVGSGAFMRDQQSALKLARAMVDIGSRVGRRTVALITNMDQPLGFATGNALEVKEAIDTLKGRGPQDLLEICLELGATMLLLAGKADNVQGGKEILIDLLKSGQALNKFIEFISAQGGDPRVTREDGVLPAAELTAAVPAPSSGYIRAINAAMIGRSAMLLGAGRENKESQIDPAVGIVLQKKAGDTVKAGETLALVHANSTERLDQVKEHVQSAYQISADKPEPARLILGSVPEKL
ncbi:MAG: pyrimidine-nucleoside phosphorylase [Desulfotomaculaceae bacterium]|nr:pyrimidine-nucleoside phosphorylase [Desulfotomaculaceae bacterium]MDD4766051.1 pyrimidine-nucleoside phosphorylase [Desulfotomaculaceae bacterium]